MCVSRIAIDTAMLTTLVGIHRVFQANVRALYFIDNRFSMGLQVFCLNFRRRWRKIKVRMIGFAMGGKGIIGIELGTTTFHKFLF
jgi:hypothetical protein